MLRHSWAAVLMGKARKTRCWSVERFFRSDWYDTLTRGAVDGEWLMRNIKIRELENTLENI